MKQTLLITGLLACLTLMTGCVSLQPIDSTVERVFTYDYQIPDKSKSDIYTAAFNFIALNYNDSKSVLRVTDAKNGLIIGKGVSVWQELGTNRHTPHDIMFAAKEGRARLQITIAGTAQASAIGGVYVWPLPTPGGYNQMVEQFNNLSNKLENELKDNSDLSKFIDF